MVFTPTFLLFRTRVTYELRVLKQVYIYKVTKIPTDFIKNLLFWPEVIRFEMSKRDYLRPVSTTVRCGQRLQPLKGHTIDILATLDVQVLVIVLLQMACRTTPPLRPTPQPPHYLMRYLIKCFKGIKLGMQKACKNPSPFHHF